MPYRHDKAKVKPIHRDFKKVPPPLASIYLHTTATDDLIVIPHVSRHTRNFIGIGRVVKISRGKEFDLVSMIFDCLGHKSRTIIVFNNHARRQLIGLRKGQYSIVYGVLKRYRDKHKENQNLVWHYSLIAFVFSPIYTPKAIDIKKYEEDIENGEVESQIEKMTERQQIAFNYIAEDILRNNGLKQENLGEDKDDWEEFFKPFDQVEDD